MHGHKVPKIQGMQNSAPLAFFESLNPSDQSRLLAMDRLARQAPPTDFVRWFCGDALLGYLSPERAAWLVKHLAGCSMVSKGLEWRGAGLTALQRSDALQGALLQAKGQGLLPGWRNEPFSFWHCDWLDPDPQVEPLFSVERSGFRWLGMLSHAVHVNGFLPDGRLWVARRSFSKATDPGMLDNVTAGGLPAGETVHDCLQRELAEEAGLFHLERHPLKPAGQVRTARLEAEGWHDEVLHVFNLTLSGEFVPSNQDGEVAEFMCLSAAETLARIDAGAFTVDATQTLMQGLRALKRG